MSELIIQRVPLSDDDKYDNYSSHSFKPLPYLFLELVENKTKLNPTAIKRRVGIIGATTAKPSSAVNVAPTALTRVDATDTIQSTPTATRVEESRSDDANVGDEMSEEEKASKEKSNLYFQYLVLKQMYPNSGVEIPPYNVYTDVNIMRQKYDMLSKQLHLDNSVESWKRYMAIFVMGCEILFGQLNFDMEGFAHHQIMNMNSYDQLLVELAEKTYVPKGSNWPVEIRLVGVLALNMAMFIFQKIISRQAGGSSNNNLLNLINGLSSKLAANASATSATTTMKGP